MQPIVNGIREDYENTLVVTDLNARDGGTGEASFKALNLPGHPGFVLFDASGQEQFRAFGQISESVLLEAVERLLSASTSSDQRS